MIETIGLARRFGSITALHPLTVSLPAGTIVGLLGANGAGKTTTLNLLTTLLEPSEGTATVAGCDILTDPLGVRRAIGYVPEHATAYEGLTADEYLELAGRVRGLDEDTWRSRADRFLIHLGLGGDRGRRLGTYSKGMRAKVLLAAALLHDPKVLILDEPMSGLDVHGQTIVADLLLEMAAAGRTVLYSSHVLEQVEQVAQVLVLVHAGRLLWHGRIDDLRHAHGDAPLSTIFVRLTEPGIVQGMTWAQLLGTGAS